MKKLVRKERPQEVKDLEMVLLEWLFIFPSIIPGTRICRFCKGEPFLHSFSECPGKKLEDVLEEFDHRFSVLVDVPDEVVEPDECVERCAS